MIWTDLEFLAEAVARQDPALQVLLPAEPPEHVRRLFETLGVTWRVDERAGRVCGCRYAEWLTDSPRKS